MRVQLSSKASFAVLRLRWKRIDCLHLLRVRKPSAPLWNPDLQCVPIAGRAELPMGTACATPPTSSYAPKSRAAGADSLAPSHTGALMEAKSFPIMHGDRTVGSLNATLRFSV